MSEDWAPTNSGANGYGEKVPLIMCRHSPDFSLMGQEKFFSRRTTNGRSLITVLGPWAWDRGNGASGRNLPALSVSKHACANEMHTLATRGALYGRVFLQHVYITVQY